MDFEDKTQPNNELDAKLDDIAEACGDEEQPIEVQKLFAKSPEFHPPTTHRS